MWFLSVSWSTNCPVYFSYFLVDQKKFVQSQIFFVHSSPVHVVLVSLLVDQLSGLFLTFFGRPKKICSVSGNFWSGSDFFGRPNFFLVHQNFFFLYQKIRAWPKKIRDWPKIPWDCTNFFLVDQKKWEIDRTIGQPRDWPKPHGRD